MQKIALVFVVLLIVVLGLLGCVISQTLGIRDYLDAIEGRWYQYVQVVDERDQLIQQLVERSEAARTFEEGCLVVDLSAPLSSAESPAAVFEFVERQDRLGLDLERFLSTPAAAAVPAFAAPLRGLSNRVDVARSKVNDSIRVHNTQLEKFPTSIVARIVGWGKRELP